MRQWIMLVLGVLLFGVITYKRLTQVPGERNRVPAAAIPERTVPDFRLLDTAGKTVTNADLRGRPALYYFFFSTCPGICPILNKHAAQLRDALPASNPLRIVGVSVNPETDTPEVLQSYGTRFNVDPQRWLMLTGDREAIFELSTKGFLLAAAESKPEDIPANGPVIHAPQMVLVDKEGKLVRYFDGLEEDVAQQVITTMKVESLDN